MATVNKNFRIKDGLIVEGTTGTINGEDILTTGFTTDSLDEGSTNQYYTEARAKTDAAELLTGASLTNITITGDGNGLTITAENGVADSTTDDLEEGTTNLYFTNQRAIDAVGGSATSANTPDTVVKRDAGGDFAASDVTVTSVIVGTAGTISDEGLLAIDSATGTSTSVTGDTGVEIASANGNIVLNADGNVYKGTASAGNELVTQGNVDAYIGDGTVNGSTGNTITDRITTVSNNLSDHASDTGTHGVGEIVGASETQTLSNKTFSDTVTFGANGSTIAGDVGSAGDLDVVAGDNLHLTATTGNIILSADGAAYYGSASAENEFATHGYVDNAVAGLAWKESVNLLWSDSNATLTGATGTLVIDGHAALDTDNVGYRILITSGANRGIWTYADDNANWTLTRSADADSVAELIGAAVYVMEGTQYGATSWVQGNHYATQFTDQLWTQFSGSGSVTAGTGIAVDGLEVSVDRSTVDGWYDAAGSANTAESNANTYTDNSINALDTDDIEEGSTNVYFTDGRAKDSAASLLTGATLTNITITGTGNGGLTITAENGVADSTTDDLEEGSNNLYFTDERAIDAVSNADIYPNAVIIDNVAKQVAAQTNILGSVTGVVISFAKADYRTAKFLVKIDNATHNEVTEVLLTLDASDNIAITEYAIVGTNGSRGTISATVNGANVDLTVTPVNDSEITVVGTLLI